jgi:hypothetical protein
LLGIESCPDTDKDGVAEKMTNVLLLQDQKKMLVVLGLIPDDGVLYKDDKCPEVKYRINVKNENRI